MSFEYLKKREKIRLTTYFVGFGVIFGGVFTYTYFEKERLENESHKLSLKIEKIKQEAIEKAKLVRELRELKAVLDNLMPEETYSNHHELQEALRKLVKSPEFYTQPILLETPGQENHDLMAMRMTFTDKIDVINDVIYKLICAENCKVISKVTIIGGEESRHNCELESQFSMGGNKK